MDVSDLGPDPKVVIGNEYLTRIPTMLGPANSFICEKHGYVKRELLLMDGTYLPVCYKCIILNVQVGMAQHVTTPGERGSRSFPASTGGSE